MFYHLEKSLINMLVKKGPRYSTKSDEHLHESIDDRPLFSYSIHYDQTDSKSLIRFEYASDWIYHA